MKMLPTLLAMLTLTGVSATYAQLNTRLTGRQVLGTESADVWTQGNLAYVARGDDGMSMVDVTNPAAPVLRGTFAPVGCHMHDVEVVGNFAYMANHVFNNSGQPIVGLYIAEVSDPDNPVEAGRIEWGMGGGYHLGGSSYSIHIEARGPQRIAYIASNITSELEVFDVTVPNAAVYLNTILNPLWTYNSQPHEMVVRGNLLLTSWLQGGVTVDDVSNLAAPVRLAHAPTTPNYNYDAKFSADGTHILTTEAGVSGGGIFKIRTLASLGAGTLPLVSTLTSPNATLFHNIAVQGQYAYVANFLDGLRILDINNPAAPFIAGHYDTDPATTSGSTSNGGIGVRVAGNNIFLSHGTGGLYIVDFVDTIAITKAEWSNRNNRLTVEATSTGAPHLTLTLAGYGTMTWSNSLGRYQRVQNGVNSLPGSVTVTSSIDGTASGSVRRVK